MNIRRTVVILSLLLTLAGGLAGRAAVPRVIANRSSPLAASLNGAETDAKRRMEMRISRLPVRPGVTVGDVCGTDEPSLDSEPDIRFRVLNPQLPA